MRSTPSSRKVPGRPGRVAGVPARAAPRVAVAALSLALGLALGAQAAPTGLAALAGTQALQAATAAPLPAPAPAPVAASTPGPLRFAIARYALEGATLVEPGLLEAALEPHAGPGRSFDDVEAAVRAVRSLYERAGYSSVQVSVPEQALVANVVRLRVLEPKVGRVELVGAQHRTSGNVRRAVPTLAEGRTPSDTVLSGELRLANENPGRQMLLTMRAEPDEQLTAVLRVADQPAWLARASLDNGGPPGAGRVRVSLGAQHANLLERDIVGAVQLQSAPEAFEDVRIASVSARVPLYGSGLMLDLSALYSSVDSGTVRTAAGDYLLASSGRNLALRLTRLLPRVGTVEPRAWVGWESRLVESRVTTTPGGASLVPDIELRPLQAGLMGTWRTSDLSVSGQLAASHNVPGAGRSAAAAFARPGLRAGADPRYTLARAAASVSHFWAGGSVHANWSGQWSGDLLMAAEQFGIGGEGSVRGFETRVASGDRGQRLSMEWMIPARELMLGTPLEVTWLAFLDLGQVRRLQPQPGENERATLVGGGLGLRLQQPRGLALRLDLGGALRAVGVAPARGGFLHMGAEYML